MDTDAEPKPTAEPKLKRRWFQFSISALLGLIVACGVVLALVVNPARRQRRAVEFVESLGGGIEYAGKFDEQSVQPPELLQDTLGRDCFRTVDTVRLNGTQINDAGLERLKSLTALGWLNLSDTQITDGGLEQLKGLTELKWLNLSGTQVTDSGLERLKGHAELRTLNLRDTQVSDAGLAQLKVLTSLRDIDLRATQVSNAGVAELQSTLPDCVIYH